MQKLSKAYIGGGVSNQPDDVVNFTTTAMNVNLNALNNEQLFREKINYADVVAGLYTSPLTFSYNGTGMFYYNAHFHILMYIVSKFI